MFIMAMFSTSFIKIILVPFNGEHLHAQKRAFIGNFTSFAAFDLKKYYSVVAGRSLARYCEPKTKQSRFLSLGINFAISQVNVSGALIEIALP